MDGANILAVDCGHYELIVFNILIGWWQTPLQNATMKQNDYNFSLVKFDKLVSFLTESYTFPFYVEQLFFADDLN